MLRAWLLALGWWVWLGCAQAQGGAAQVPPEVLPLPELKGTVTLRVAYVDNPRLPPLAPQRAQRVLLLAQGEMQRHLGVAVVFAPPVRLSIGRVFGGLPAPARRNAERERLDATVDPARLEPLVPALLQDLREAGDLPAQRAFAQGHLLQEPADGSDTAFARALLATHHGLLLQWGQARARDGAPVIGPDRFNEYSYWNVLGQGSLPFEVVLTNQLIASAERTENSVHSAIRGGLSNGITTWNRKGRYRLVSIVSSYGFMDPSPLARRMRGESPGAAPIPEAQVDSYMAQLLAHELGHQLLHLGHPFGNPACIMAPPKALGYRAWSSGLQPERCPLGSSPQQTPGFVKFVQPR